MSKNYYHIKPKRSSGGIGFAVLISGKHSEVVIGGGLVNKNSDLELKVKDEKIVSISKDYKFIKIYEDDFGRLKRKEEKYKNLDL